MYSLSVAVKSDNERAADSIYLKDKVVTGRSTTWASGVLAVF